MQDVEKRALQFYMYTDMEGYLSQSKDGRLTNNLQAEYAGTADTDFCQASSCRVAPTIAARGRSPYRP